MFDPTKGEKETPVICNIHNAAIYFDWSWKYIGFGQLSLQSNEDGVIEIDSECMSRDRVRKMLHAFADYVADNGVIEHE